MLAPSPDAKDFTRAVGVDYLAIRSRGESYALPVMAIAEILRVPHITRVPRAPAAVAGIATVRGAIVTVFDLPKLVALEGETTRGPASRILLVERPGERVGLLVDGVTEVFRIQKDKIEPASVLGGEPGSHILAVARPKGVPIILLNEMHLFEERA